MGSKAAFNPAFPHIYIPVGEWSVFVYKFNRDYKERGIQCTDNKYGECKFQKKCEQIIKESNIDLSFKMTLETNVIEMPFYEMLIPGSELGGNDNQCYLGVFRNPDFDGDWILGTNVMQNYYVVFDAS